MYNSKRKINSDVNAFKSQKDVFDWDLNTLMTYEREQKTPKKLSYVKEMAQKNLYTSKLFTGEDEKTSHVKKVYMGQSDIFNTRTEPNTPLSNSSRGISRKNRNLETSQSTAPDKLRPAKTLKMTQQKLSADNPFL